MTAPKPPNPAEFVVVPREPTVEQVQVGRERTSLFGIGAVYKAMLATAPDTGLVPVPRELLQAVQHALSLHAAETFGWEGEDENCGDLADELRAILAAQKENNGG